MENEEKKLEYYTIKPTLKQFYGVKVNEDTTFDDKTDDGCVIQHFENLTLTSEIKRKIEPSDNYPYEVEETSKSVVKMPSGTILVWTTEEGWVLPQYEMINLTGLEKEIEEVKQVYKDSIV